MSEQPITQEQIDDLLAKLRATDLEENQRKLLEAMIKLATDVQDHQIFGVPEFDVGFRTSFTPAAAELVLSYADDESEGEGPSGIKRSQVTQYITRGIHP